MGIKKDDEVITTPFTFAATANSIVYTQAKPVFADINPKTYNLDPEKIEEKITDKTKAIMPVHLYGQPADMDPIMKIAKDNDLKVIEDAAQAHGALYNDQPVGSIGNMGCFSFYPTKNMTTSEGGMVTTNDAKLEEQSSMIRAHGESNRYNHVMLGYNFRMTDIAASIGLVQLKHVDEFNNKRITNAKYLTEALENVDGIRTPEKLSNVKHVYHQYTIRIDKNRDKFQEYLTDNGVGTGIHYPNVIYKQNYYQEQGYVGNCPNAEKASQQVLSIPVHPSLTQNDLDTVVETIKKAAQIIL